MSYNLYNVYRDGELVFENARSRDVANFTGCTANSVSAYARKGDRVKGIYSIRIMKQCENEKLYSDAERAFAMRYGVTALKQWIFMNQRYGTRNGGY